MICQRIKPAICVSNHIREYVLMDMNFDRQTVLPVKAYPVNPEEGMSFQIRGSLFAETPELNLTEKRARSYVFGQPELRQNMHRSHEFTKIHVRFQPGALFKLLLSQEKSNAFIYFQF